MELIDIMREFGVAVGFAVYLIIQTRIDRADALRREAAYSARLEQLTERLLSVMEQNADANRGLRDQLHDLKNVIQKGIFDMDARRENRDNRETRGVPQ